MCLSINTNTWSYIVVLLAYLYDTANIPIRPKDKKITRKKRHQFRNNIQKDWEICFEY